MPPTLSQEELRVLGCLMEKSVVTPDQYPLTLNALTNACNQKSSREPIMHLEPGTAQRTIRLLEAKHLVRTEENFKSRTEKYIQRFCNTPFSDYQFDPAQFAVMTLLLLRGPQTPGELRARSGRLHSFADNQAVVETLNTLMTRDGDALVAILPRQAGRKDSQYLHLFAGQPENASVTPPPVAVPEPTSSAAPAASEGGELAQLQERVAALEAEVAALKAALGEDT